MTATLTKEDIKVFNVSNKFGFLNISDDSEDEVIKPRKNVRKSKYEQKFDLVITLDQACTQPKYWVG